MITITLSAADATAHIIGNPFVPAAFDHPIALTLVLLALLAAVFLKGFQEAIGLAVGIVGVYLAAERRRHRLGPAARSLAASRVLPALARRAASRSTAAR